MSPNFLMALRPVSISVHRGAVFALALVLLLMVAHPAHAQEPLSSPQTDAECQSGIAMRHAQTGSLICTEPDRVQDFGVSTWSRFQRQTATVAAEGVVFVYGDSQVAANEFKTLLETPPNAYTVTMVPITDVVATDFSAALVVVIGTDTGYLTEWPRGTEGVSTPANHLASFSKPVMALGEGGYAYFGKLSDPIGYPFGTHGLISEVVGRYMSSPFWTTPTDFASATDPVKIYTDSTDEVGIHLVGNPDALPFGIESVGGKNFETHAPLVGMRTKPYLLWGFSGSPALMTVEGKKLFVNAIEYLRAWPASLLPEYPLYLPLIDR